jgi:hypothetical protein
MSPRRRRRRRRKGGEGEESTERSFTQRLSRVVPAAVPGGW